MGRTVLRYSPSPDERLRAQVADNTGNTCAHVGEKVSSPG